MFFYVSLSYLLFNIFFNIFNVYPVWFLFVSLYGVLVFIIFFSVFNGIFIFYCHSGDFFAISLYEGRSLTPTGA